MAETVRARAWIAATLAGDATFRALAAGIEGRIFDRAAPPGTPYPLVRLEVRGPGEDYLLIGGRRGWSNPLILVYVAADGPSTVAIEALADRIDALLHLASGSAGAGVIWECVRERPFDLPDTSVSPAASRLGGEYRIKVS